MSLNTRENYEEMMNNMRLQEMLLDPNIPKYLEKQIKIRLILEKLIRCDGELLSERADTVISKIKTFDSDLFLVTKNNGIRNIRTTNLGPSAINWD